MYNNLSTKENLKRLKLLLQMKKEIRKLERKLRYSNSLFYVNIIDSKNKDSSLKNKELTKKLQIKKDNYERLTEKNYVK